MAFPKQTILTIAELSTIPDGLLLTPLRAHHSPRHTVGDGSSMGMLREEIQTGAEKVHWQKLIDRRTQLLRAYRSGRLGASDRAIARGLLIVIQDALSTRPPI